MVHKSVFIVALLFLLLIVDFPIGAAEQPDATEAFRTPWGKSQPVATDESGTPPGIGAASASFLTPSANMAVPQILDRAPVALHYMPTAQVGQAAGASATPDSRPSAEPEANGVSASELNRQLSNPVTSLWSLTLQFNNYYLTNSRWNYNLQFQPVLPVSLTKDWNLITRPVLPLYNSVPAPVAPGQYEQTWAFGDTILLELLSPANTGPWILGAGPTFIFPTATSDFAGQGKWQAGPGVVVGYLTKEYIVGVFPQQWWSIGGSTDRPFTSQMNLQPFAALFLGEGWNIGYSGNILANWKATSKNVWTVPLGLGIGKVVRLGRLPVKFQIAGQWMAVHPQNAGQMWNIQVLITPVIPKLISESLF
jgi:hypothetical protein